MDTNQTDVRQHLDFGWWRFPAAASEKCPPGAQDRLRRAGEFWQAGRLRYGQRLGRA
jgi:hypothetical protein